MPKLWPTRSPRTLMQNYYFQLLLLSWNYLYLGQLFRNFSIGHSQRSNFQLYYHFPQQQYSAISQNLLLRKVPSILISKLQLDKFNKPTNHSFFKKNCQIFKYLVNRIRKKHYYFLLKRTTLNSYEDKKITQEKITAQLNTVCNTPFRRPLSRQPV